MKDLLPKARLLILMVAIVMMAVGFLPSRTTADEVLDGVCHDVGCPGGDTFCDYAEIGGGVYPCNLGAAEQ